MYSVGVDPKGTALLGMVILANPVVPFSPVTIKATMVVTSDSFVAMVTLDICELVMFPLIKKSTVELLFTVAFIVDEVEFGVRLGEGDGVGGGKGGKVEVGGKTGNEKFVQSGS